MHRIDNSTSWKNQNGRRLLRQGCSIIHRTHLHSSGPNCACTESSAQQHAAAAATFLFWLCRFVQTKYQADISEIEWGYVIRYVRIIYIYIYVNRLHSINIHGILNINHGTLWSYNNWKIKARVVGHNDIVKSEGWLDIQLLWVWRREEKKKVWQQRAPATK